MPELPEVQTTVSGLQKVLPGLKIVDVWSDWEKMIKDYKFSSFKKEIISEKVLSSKRRAKNILINLSGDKTILIHMKMTGHLLYGKYKKTGNKWFPVEDGPLKDPFNRFIHFVLILSDGKHLAFSDTRKFGKITLIKTSHLEHSPHLAHLGPEPLEKSFSVKSFTERIMKRPNGKIKQVLLDQTIISGIGNIYSDEMLYSSGVHPEEKVRNIEKAKVALIFSAMKKVLKKGIDFGGDSMSDYRNIYGKRGKFQEYHSAYRRTGKKCLKSGCKGIIQRKIVGGRSSHFCNTHQKLSNKK